MLPCFCIYHLTACIRRWPEYNICTFMPEFFPAIIPEYIETYLDPEFAEFSLEYRRVKRAGSKSVSNFIFGKMYFPVLSLFGTIPVKNYCSIVSFPVFNSIYRTDHITALPFCQPGKLQQYIVAEFQLL